MTDANVTHWLAPEDQGRNLPATAVCGTGDVWHNWHPDPQRVECLRCRAVLGLEGDALRRAFARKAIPCVPKFKKGDAVRVKIGMGDCGQAGIVEGVTVLHMSSMTQIIYDVRRGTGVLCPVLEANIIPRQPAPKLTVGSPEQENTR